MTEKDIITIQQTSKNIKFYIVLGTLTMFVCFGLSFFALINSNAVQAIAMLGCSFVGIMIRGIAEFIQWWNHG